MTYYGNDSRYINNLLTRYEQYESSDDDAQGGKVNNLTVIVYFILRLT